jgi:hypothetical protein
MDRAASFCAWVSPSEERTPHGAKSFAAINAFMLKPALAPWV